MQGVGCQTYLDNISTPSFSSGGLILMSHRRNAEARPKERFADKPCTIYGCSLVMDRQSRACLPSPVCLRMPTFCICEGGQIMFNNIFRPTHLRQCSRTENLTNSISTQVWYCSSVMPICWARTFVTTKSDQLAHLPDHVSA